MAVLVFRAARWCVSPYEAPAGALAASDCGPGYELPADECPGLVEPGPSVHVPPQAIVHPSVVAGECLAHDLDEGWTAADDALLRSFIEREAS